MRIATILILVALSSGALAGPRTGETGEVESRGSLSAWVYDSVVESCTHRFITHSFYHTQDWTDFDQEHENDQRPGRPRRDHLLPVEGHDRDPLVGERSLRQEHVRNRYVTDLNERGYGNARLARRWPPPLNSMLSTAR